MEAIACIVRRNIEVIEGLGIPVDEIRVLGGGARSAVWNQIKCDLTGRPVVTTANEEAACLGAAMLAGQGDRDVRLAGTGRRRMVVVKDRLEPDPERHSRYNETYERYRELYDSLVGMFGKE